ncbi:MAG: hypothetical protein MUC43_07970 [Pirellula sp.]|nr:hypothetical protein [Pirellula sp.]
MKNLTKAVEKLCQYDSWTDAERIRVLVETLDNLNNGDALAYLDHWMAKARPLLVVTPATPVSGDMGVTTQ